MIKFIKAKNCYGYFYINVDHIELISTWKGGLNTIHYEIQYEDNFHNHKTAEISEDDFNFLVCNFSKENEVNKKDGK